MLFIYGEVWVGGEGGINSLGWDGMGWNGKPVVVVVVPRLTAYLPRGATERGLVIYVVLFYCV